MRRVAWATAGSSMAGELSILTPYASRLWRVVRENGNL